MNVQASELLSLAAMIGIAVPFIAIALTGDDIPLALGARGTVVGGGRVPVSGAWCSGSVRHPEIGKRADGE